jgi:hypothetical protein
MARNQLGPGGRPPVEGEGLNRRVTVNFSSSDMKDLEVILKYHDPAPFKQKSISTAIRFAVRKIAEEIRAG